MAMTLHGKHQIGNRRSRSGDVVFRAVDPSRGTPLEPAYAEATPAEIDAALDLAWRAHQEPVDTQRRANFLMAAADNIDRLGDELTQRADIETALGATRLQGERARTVNQLRMFADLVREGSWVDARIDLAQPDRKPSRRPDLRRMLVPLGPVVVFGASNFPLAFSAAGGDTASALAAGCPVVVKGHPSHPGTSELVAGALVDAACRSGMPEGTFSLLHGASHEVGARLVTHPHTRAIGFTGSLTGGRALFDLAARRPQPIPVFAEMGSINPVFVLPAAQRARGEQIAAGLAGSLTLGVGQFCTNPGLVVAVAGAATDAFAQALAAHVSKVTPGVMLNQSILDRYRHDVAERDLGMDVDRLTRASPSGDLAVPTVHRVSAHEFLRCAELSQELFGPATLLVVCDHDEQLVTLARALDGQLSATVFADADDAQLAARLLPALVDRAGRVLFEGYPTGVEVCPAMQHGGPYPASTDSRTTSVGTAAIERFARPVCFQDCPASLLPTPLRDENPLGLLRTVGGHPTRDPTNFREHEPSD